MTVSWGVREAALTQIVETDTASQIDETVAACTRLFIDYARFVDFGEYDRFVDLFTEDAVLDLGFRLEGQDAIRRSMTKRPEQLRSRHVLSNISIDVLDEQAAKGIAYLSLYRHLGADSLLDQPIAGCTPAGVGHYSNAFRFTEKGWRIASCTLQFAFRDASQFPG